MVLSFTVILACPSKRAVRSLEILNADFSICASISEVFIPASLSLDVSPSKASIASIFNGIAETFPSAVKFRYIHEAVSWTKDTSRPITRDSPKSFAHKLPDSIFETRNGCSLSDTESNMHSSL
ncbi:hypothetical protein D3C85_1521980 [compost metagenome]